MTKEKEKAERDLEAILSRLFSEEWANWNEPKVQDYLKGRRLERNAERPKYDSRRPGQHRRDFLASA